MRVSILLGRGVEGCGVTQCAVQMQNETNAKIYATNDKKWPRAKGINFPVTEFSAAKDWQKYATEINDVSDVVVIYSVPSKSHPEACNTNFLSMVRAITCRKIFINVDHKSQSISRNANLKEICESVDVLMTHSLENPFADFVLKSRIKTPIKKMRLGFGYDAHRAKYWQPIEKQDSNKVLWIGRSTGWKGPQLMIDFHQKKLKSSQYITVLEGLEASIGYKGIMYDKKLENRYDVVSFFRPEVEHNDPKWPKDGSQYGKEVRNSGAYLYPPYANVEAMHRMALSAFGSDLYHLPAHMYGDNIENCHAEIVASGSIPIFHKHFCDNVVHKKQGKPISECINTGTLGLDETNYDDIFSTMLKLSNDPVMRDEWREMSFEFWKQHSDSKTVIEEIFEMGKSTKSDKRKPIGLEEFFV